MEPSLQYSLAVLRLSTNFSIYDNDFGPNVRYVYLDIHLGDGTNKNPGRCFQNNHHQKCTSGYICYRLCIMYNGPLTPEFFPSDRERTEKRSH